MPFNSILAPKATSLVNPEKIYIQGNSVKAQSSSLNPLEMKIMGVLTSDWTKDDIIYTINQKYPSQAKLLIYMVRNESSFCQNMRGDSGLAYGCFQIHLDKHEISYECAMDFLCSLDWTVEKINEGKGYLWTSCRRYYGY